MQIRTLASAALLGVIAVGAAGDERSESRDSQSRSELRDRQESVRSVLERKQAKQRAEERPALPATERRHRVPKADEPVPVRNPHRTVIPGAGEGAPPTVINPEQGRIRITGLTAIPDLASGRRQARMELSANVPITHFRAVQVTSANADAPFAGVPWHAYGGDAPVVSLLQCGVHPSWAYRETIAVQLKGEAIPNPNLSSAMMENTSHIQRVDMDVPPALRSRFSTTLYLNPPTDLNVEPLDLGPSPLFCPGQEHCYIAPGRPTNARVQVLQLHVRNYPGTLTAAAVKRKRGSCLLPVYVHDVHDEGDGQARFTLDAQMSGNACVPELVLGACGSVDERYHSRTVPARFEQQTLVYSDSAEFDGLSFNETCTVEEHDGDFTIASTEGGCSSRVTYGGDSRLEVYWKSHQQGNCALQQPIDLPIPPTPGGLLLSASLNRMSDYHPGYDLYRPFKVQPHTISSPVTLTPARSHWLRQDCLGIPARVNQVRTRIDRIDATRWRRTPIHTAR